MSSLHIGITKTRAGTGTYPSTSYRYETVPNSTKQYETVNGSMNSQSLNGHANIQQYQYVLVIVKEVAKIEDSIYYLVGNIEEVTEKRVLCIQ